MTAVQSASGLAPHPRQLATDPFGEEYLVVRFTDGQTGRLYVGKDVAADKLAVLDASRDHYLTTTEASLHAESDPALRAATNKLDAAEKKLLALREPEATWFDDYVLEPLGFGLVAAVFAAMVAATALIAPIGIAAVLGSLVYNVINRGKRHRNADAKKADVRQAETQLEAAREAHRKAWQAIIERVQKTRELRPGAGLSSPLKEGLAAPQA